MASKFTPPRFRSPSLVLFALLPVVVFILLVLNPPSLPSTLLPSTHLDWKVPTSRPLLVYTKPRKTGSTFISSMLGNAILRSGGRVAPCSAAGLATSSAPYYGIFRSYDMLGCHENLTSFSISALLSLPREIVFVTSTREPISWFISAAVWVYERQNDVRVENASLLRDAIDYALDGGEKFLAYQRLFLADHGLNSSSTQSQIVDITNIYTYVFDHATAEDDVNRALVDLGYSTSRASSRREGVYDASWVAGYRADDIRNATKLEKRLYDRLMLIRQTRLDQHAGWADPNAEQVKTYYSAAGMRGRGMNRSRTDPAKFPTV